MPLDPKQVIGVTYPAPALDANNKPDPRRPGYEYTINYLDGSSVTYGLDQMPDAQTWAGYSQSVANGTATQIAGQQREYTVDPNQQKAFIADEREERLANPAVKPTAPPAPRSAGTRGNWVYNPNSGQYDYQVNPATPPIKNGDMWLEYNPDSGRYETMLDPSGAPVADWSAMAQHGLTAENDATTNALHTAQTEGAYATAANTPLTGLKDANEVLTANQFTTPLAVASGQRQAQNDQFSHAADFATAAHNRASLAQTEGQDTTAQIVSLLPHLGPASFGNAFANTLNPALRASGAAPISGDDFGVQVPDLGRIRQQAEERVAGPGGMTLPDFASDLRQAGHSPAYTPSPEALHALSAASVTAAAALGGIRQRLGITPDVPPGLGGPGGGTLGDMLSRPSAQPADTGQADNASAPPVPSTPGAPPAYWPDQPWRVPYGAGAA